MRSPLATLFTALTLALPAWAQEPIVYEGVDIAPAVEYLKTRIYVTNREFKTYNYARSGPLQDRASAYAVTKARAGAFWREFGKPDLDNIWGQGMYLAVDPVVTVKYGGGEGDAQSLANFRLTEVTIPVGSRVLMLNLTESPSAGLDTMRAVAAHFDCDRKIDTMGLFFWAAFQSKDRCIAFTRKVFQDILQPDLLLYSYSQAVFPNCTRKTGGEAFVVLKGDRWRPQDIRVYDRNSRDFTEDRRMIQTLFAFHAAQAPVATLTVGLLQKSLARAPLWADLLGQPAAAGASEWLQQNHFTCGGQPPFNEPNYLR